MLSDYLSANGSVLAEALLRPEVAFNGKPRPLIWASSKMGSTGWQPVTMSFTWVGQKASCRHSAGFYWSGAVCVNAASNAVPSWYLSSTAPGRQGDVLCARFFLRELRARLRQLRQTCRKYTWALSPVLTGRTGRAFITLWPMTCSAVQRQTASPCGLPQHAEGVL